MKFEYRDFFVFGALGFICEISETMDMHMSYRLIKNEINKKKKKLIGFIYLYIGIILFSAYVSYSLY